MNATGRDPSDKAKTKLYLLFEKQFSESAIACSHCPRRTQWELHNSLRHMPRHAHPSANSRFPHTHQRDAVRTSTWKLQLCKQHETRGGSGEDLSGSVLGDTAPNFLAGSDASPLGFQMLNSNICCWQYDAILTTYKVHLLPKARTFYLSISWLKYPQLSPKEIWPLSTDLSQLTVVLCSDKPIIKLKIQ